MPNTPLNAWNGQIPSDVLLDSGVLNIGAALFSATMGGLKYDPGMTRRNIEFDGKRSDVALLDRNVMFKPKMTGTIIQVPNTTMLQVEGGGVTGTVTGGPTSATQVVAKQGGVMYAAGDYLTNARMIFERADGTYWQVRFPKALVTKWDLAGVDKEEGKWNIEIEARLDLSVSGAKPYDPPMVYEYSAALT
jgi:hypothetical protein